MPMINGQVCTKVTGDASFIAKLTPGTILQFTLSGKLGGTINGMPVSGHGHLEYTYRYGAASWELDADGLAQGPSLPAGPIVYLPAGASGNAAVTTTGTTVSAAPYTSLKDRYHFKLKGRVTSITVAVFDDAVVCDLTGLCSQTDPTAWANANLTGDCLTQAEMFIATQCPPV